MGSFLLGVSGDGVPDISFVNTINRHIQSIVDALFGHSHCTIGHHTCCLYRQVNCADQAGQRRAGAGAGQ